MCKKFNCCIKSGQGVDQIVGHGHVVRIPGDCGFTFTIAIFVRFDSVYQGGEIGRFAPLKRQDLSLRSPAVGRFWKKTTRNNVTTRTPSVSQKTIKLKSLSILSLKLIDTLNTLFL